MANFHNSISTAGMEKLNRTRYARKREPKQMLRSIEKTIQRGVFFSNNLNDMRIFQWISKIEQIDDALS